jgi:hypothetical protein
MDLLETLRSDLTSPDCHSVLRTRLQRSGQECGLIRAVVADELSEGRGLPTPYPASVCGRQTGAYWVQRWGVSKRDEEPLIASREVDAAPVAGPKRAFRAPQRWQEPCFRSASSVQFDPTTAANDRREVLSVSWTGTEFALREAFFSSALTPKAAMGSLRSRPHDPGGTVLAAGKHRRPAPAAGAFGFTTGNQKLRKKPCAE